MAYYVETNHWICSVLNWVRFRQMQRPPTFWGPSGLHFGGLYFFVKIGKSFELLGINFPDLALQNIMYLIQSGLTCYKMFSY